MENSDIEERIEEIIHRISPNGMSQGEKEDLLEELDSILSVNPNNTDVLEIKAMVYEFTNDYENAIATYKKISEINPGETDIENNIKDCENFMEWHLKNEANKNSSKKDLSGIWDIKFEISVWHILIFKIIVIAIICVYFTPAFLKIT